MATLVLDDRSPDISYTGGLWLPGGVSSEYNSTTTWINGTGGIVNLQFTGVRVSVWGTIGNTADGADPSTSYAIDGGAPFLFSATQDSDIHYQQMFFLSGPLDPTSHTLTIETLTPGAAYYLDDIQIDVPPSADQLPTTTVNTVSTTVTLTNDIPTSITTMENVTSTHSTRLISAQTASDSTESNSTANVPVPVATTTAITTHTFVNGTPTSSISTVTENIISTASASTEASNVSTASRPVPMTAIVGGSLGGLVVIICIFLILRFRVLRRCKVELEQQLQPQPQRSKINDTVLHEDGHAAPTRGRNLQVVTPFPLKKPESPAPSYSSLSPP